MKCTTLILGVLLCFMLAANPAWAQAPVSVSGKAFILAPTSGVAPFAGFGAGLLLPANSGSSYTLVNITNLTSSTGTYLYNASNTDGLVTVTNSVTGIFSGDFTFSTGTGGTYAFNQTSSGGEQNGNFNLYAGQAPASLAGKTLYLTVQGGTTNSGTATAAFTSTGVTLTSGGSSITASYSYSILNTCAGKINGSALGVAVTAYFAFSDPANGGFAVQDSSGYEYGTFNIPDHVAPTEQITTPAAGMLVSNMNYNILGKAADNVAVSNVLYSFNGGAWTNAMSGNDWSNWTATVVLQPGTNVFSTFAIDTSGNVSPTNTVRFQYVVTTPLAVSTNGLGTLNPNYNGALLQVGRSYTITATAGSGFAFTNWFGGTTLPLGWLTNSSTIQFTMESNLVLQANFVDVTKPTLSITNITSGMTVSNQTFTVRGTSHDNVAAANVYYSLNGDDWTNADSDNSWSNWNSVVTLLPGTNTIAAYSVDTTGNISPTNAVKVVYIVSAVLSVSTNGLGTLNPNYNGALLQVGRNYTITATAGSGFAFTNWFGGTTLPLGWLTNGSTVQFTMDSNLVLQANFVDVTKPTLSITNITSGMTVSNQTFTVRGTARDNVAVANVYYSLNSNGWTSADSINAWSNWNATVSLLPGTNTIAAYSVDITGNPSATNTVKLVYIVSAVLSVSTNGLGTLNPNYNGALLQIGRSYTITATTGSGFAFTNWFGSTTLPLVWLTNGATVQFTMVTNLMLQANFADVTKPTLSITNVTPGMMVSNQAFTVRGTAGDNVAVANVVYSLNGLAWSNAVPTQSWSNWNATITLLPGTNSFIAYSIDTSGNHSPTNSVKLDYIVTTMLTVSTNGVGTLNPNYNGTLLQIGRNYTITATPGSGFVFTNWIGGTILPEVWLTNGATVQFTMISNLMLQADFVDVTKPNLAISTPTSGQHMTNALATVRGTASDNWKVASVWYQLNGGVWSRPGTTNGWTNWAATVQLQASNNTFRAYALDLGGNYSITNSVSFWSSNTFKLQLGFGSNQPMTAKGLDVNLQLSTGLNGHIEVSTDLLHWTALTNFTGTNTSIDFYDSGVTSPVPRFYRAAIP